MMFHLNIQDDNDDV